ncbi:hypothetical protein [Mesorhizobium sp. M0520]|uniref:hypothetical protein n=1 Tax=Mesorhizobium sp. M0520 TaxID=2956957 RepID=UPI00333A9C72
MSEHPIIESVRADIEGLDFADDDKRQNAEDSIICTVQTLIDRLADAEKRSSPPVAEAVAWRGVVEGRTAFLCRTKDEIDRLASDYNATIEPLFAHPLPKAPIEPGEGLSEWSGWDQSRYPWGETKHKDAVLEALFRGPWSVEDAAALIGFIDRTWTRRPTAGRAALQQEPQP